MAPRLLVSTTMRALIVVAVFASPIAHAEPATNVRASIQPTFATISRTTTYSLFGAPTVGDSRTMTGSGFGARFEVGAGWSLGSSVELGGVLRLGYHPFDARFTEDGFATRHDIALRPVQIGPQLTIRHARFFVRGDVALGWLPDVEVAGEYTLHSDGVLGMVEVGGQVGYQFPLGAGIDAQLGVAASVAWIRSNEDGDQGEYVDRTRMVAVAATFSAVRSF